MYCLCISGRVRGEKVVLTQLESIQGPEIPYAGIQLDEKGGLYGTNVEDGQPCPQRPPSLIAALWGNLVRDKRANHRGNHT